MITLQLKPFRPGDLMIVEITGNAMPANIFAGSLLC
jgi:hypothetical protein